MSVQLQGPQSSKPQGRKRRPWILWMVISLFVSTVVTLTAVFIVKIQGPNVLSVVSIIVGMVTGLLSLMIPFFQSHHSNPTHTPESAAAAPPTSPTPQIVVQVPLAPSTPPQSPLPDKSTYRGIVGLPPPTDARTSQQRETAVKEVYAKLTQPDITAIVLTGIAGVGKSTLAALVYQYAEERRRASIGPFTAKTVWLSIDPAVTIADLVGSLFEVLGRPLLETGNLAPQSQAIALFDALNMIENARLIVLDQFENLLDNRTEHALADRPGIGEWLDVLNSQPCTCRILLTSRPWPQGTRDYPPTYMQEYSVKGLEAAEGAELLRKQGVEAPETELYTAVKRCEGHGFSLTLLASLLRRNRSLSLTSFSKDPTYSQFWAGDIARNLLDYIYTQQMDQMRRKLLLAFSVYRKAVPLEAAQILIPEVSKTQVLSALDTLLAQHLLQASGEGRYQLHTIVADYAQTHFDENDEDANREALRTARAEAAQYYLKEAAEICPPREQRRYIEDVQPFIEASWQYCQAERWKEGYILLEREEVFSDLNRWGGNAALWELYQLFLPLDKWQPMPLQAARIYDGLGWVCGVLGKREQARQCFDRALKIYREIGDRGGEGTTLYDLGRVYNVLGKRKEALKHFEEALRILREVGNRKGEAKTLSSIGRVYNTQGKKEEALSRYEEALSIYREIGDRGGQGILLDHLGWIFNALGKKEEALEYSEQALKLLREVRDREGEGKLLISLGRIYMALGKREQALKHYEEALSIHREVGDRGGEGRVLDNLGRAYMTLGKREAALKYYEEALSISREVEDRGGEGTTRNNLGRLYADLGQAEKALRYYQEALSVSREVEDRGGEGATLYNIGTLYLEEKSYGEALASLLLAKKIFEEIQSPDRDEVQAAIAALRREIGGKQFAALLAQVEPRAHLVVELALGERK